MINMVVLTLVKRSWPLLILTFALLLSSPSFAFHTLRDTQEADFLWALIFFKTGDLKMPIQRTTKFWDCFFSNRKLAGKLFHFSLELCNFSYILSVFCQLCDDYSR